jgi:hypothetical protein
MTKSLNICRASTLRRALVAYSDDLEEVRSALFTAERRFAAAWRAHETANELWRTAVDLGALDAARLAQCAIAETEIEMQDSERAMRALEQRMDALGS